MKKITLVAVFMLLAFENSISQSLTYFLEQAAENNLELKARYLEFEAAMKEVSMSKSLPDPTLSLGAFISPVETRVGPQFAKLSISQMFPWFGTLKARGETKALVAEAKFYEYLDLRNKISLDIKANYYPLAELEHKIYLQEEYIQILDTYKTISTSAFENNKGSLADILRVDLLIESSRTEIKILEEKKAPIETRLFALVGTEPPSEITVSDSLLVESIIDNYRYDSLLNNHPLLNGIDKRIEATVAEENVYQKESLPKFGVGVDYMIIGERQDMNVADNGRDALMPMISISLPIYRKKYKASIQKARLSQESLLASRKDGELRLRSEYANESYDIEKALQLISLYDKQIKQSEQIKKLLLSEYSNSGENFLEILRIQQEILKYKLARISAAKDYHLAVSRLDYLTHNEEF